MKRAKPKPKPKPKVKPKTKPVVKPKPKPKPKPAPGVEPSPVASWPTNTAGIPVAPSHLSAEATEWWNIICNEYALEDSALMVLRKMMEAHDRCTEAQAILNRDGIVYHDKYGQPKTHPAVMIERDARAEFRSGFVKLGLNLEPLNASAGRPSGS